MADWYVSSAAWSAIPQFAASTAYTVGQIVRPLTAPAVGHEYAFRCTTAGTSSTEPAWPAADGSTVTTGGATFTNVSGRSAYGWSAAAGTTYAISTQVSNRPASGDRIFLSSDHVEALSVSYRVQFGSSNDFGLIQIISVNRGGSVPPAATDIQSGANIGTSNSLLYLDGYQNIYWQGITFTMLGASNMSWQINNSNNKACYFKNCAFVFNSGSSSNITSGQSIKVTLDNTTFQFGNAAQSLYFANSTQCDFNWINTPNALQGSTFPSALFVNSVGSGIATVGTLRGVDLSALTGTILKSGSSGQVKLLLDSCKIAPAVTRLGSVASSSPSGDEIELVNCYDGTSILNERHTAAGDVTADRSTYLTSGAQDDVGAYSLKLASSTRSDFAAMPLDAFALDVENTLVGTSHTATVEIISSVSLNNNDIRLLLEYLPTAGSPIVGFADSLASVLTAASALPSSSNIWTLPPTAWNPVDLLNVALSNNNLTATSTAGATSGNMGCRTLFGNSTGKYYFELQGTVWAGVSTGLGISGLGWGFGGAAASGPLVAVTKAGQIWINGGVAGTITGTGAGSIIGIAVDIGAALVWFRVAPSGNWNGSGTANPATGAGGISISGVVPPPIFPLFTGNGQAGDVCVANFGASAFSGAVPSGFTSGWVYNPNKQLLQVTFVPQQIGRMRGLARLGKPSTTVLVDPRITIS